MSTVVSFAEETCWNGEDFRHVRRAVVFKVFSIGRHLGEPFNLEFEADYGLWWDQDDEVLLYYLNLVQPNVRWSDMVFHKKADQSGIEIYETDNDRLVARIEVRKYEGRLRDLTDGDLGPNCIRITDIPARIAELRAERRPVEKGRVPSGEILDVKS